MPQTYTIRLPHGRFGRFIHVKVPRDSSEGRIVQHGGLNQPCRTRTDIPNCDSGLYCHPRLRVCTPEKPQVLAPPSTAPATMPASSSRPALEQAPPGSGGRSPTMPRAP